MKTRYYFLAAIAAFSLSALSGIPAAWVLKSHAEWTNGQVQLFGIHNSLWSGNADVLQVQQLRFAPLRWQLSPTALLTGAVKLEISTTSEGRDFWSTLTLRPGERITLTNTQGAIPVATLGKLANLNWLPVSGLFTFDLSKVKLKTGQLKHATGTAILRDARWTLTQPALDFGNLTADLSTDEDGIIHADIRSGSGPVEIKGNARLTPIGEYVVDVVIRAKADAPEKLRNLLNTLGSPQSDGSRKLNLKGKLPGAQ